MITVPASNTCKFAFLSSLKFLGQIGAILAKVQRYVKEQIWRLDIDHPDHWVGVRLDFGLSEVIQLPGDELLIPQTVELFSAVKGKILNYSNACL